MIERPRPNRMASYSTSFFDAGNPRWMDCSNRSPVGDSRRSPTPDPDDQEAPSTYNTYHLSWVESLFGAGGSCNSAIKSTMTCPFRDNMGW